MYLVCKVIRVPCFCSLSHVQNPLIVFLLISLQLIETLICIFRQILGLCGLRFKTDSGTIWTKIFRIHVLKSRPLDLKHCLAQKLIKFAVAGLFLRKTVN